MTFTLGVFDLFAYAIPGSLQLAFLTYLAVRLDLVELDHLEKLPGFLLIVGGAAASYLLGHVIYALGAALDRTLPLWKRHDDDDVQAFAAKVPDAVMRRPFVRAERHLLLSGVQLYDKEAATEISRLRAAGLMLRNSAAPLAFASVAALIELAVGPNRALAAWCVVLLPLATVASLQRGRVLRHWANVKTLEVCFWIPDIDRRVLPAGAESPGRHEAPTGDELPAGAESSTGSESSAVPAT